ncbi:MAG TPA: hypothetical protein VEC56_03985 [Candidatus Krumholzibacteria bacterium]|nr:hypothetical protein [Candidatus Krumholzibacteria bacterium]
MRKFVWTFALSLLIAAPAFADAVYYAPQVTGKKERKFLRHYLYIKNLDGDKKAVYDEYGYTAHRVRLNEYGRVKEKWTYYERGLVFVFDQCNELLETHEIEPEKRRTWQYQRDVAGYDEDVCCDDE